MKRQLTSVFGLLLALEACQSPRPAAVADTSTRSDAFYEQRRLSKAGFESADALVRKNVEVQRALYVIQLVDAPSVEVRHVNQKYTVTLNHYGHSATASITKAEWRSLSVQSNAAFMPPDTRAYRNAYRALIKKVGYCHSWTDIESTQGSIPRKLEASVCFAKLQGPSLAYADAIARLALNNLKECGPDRAMLDVIDATRSCAARLGPPTSEYRAIES